MSKHTHISDTAKRTFNRETNVEDLFFTASEIRVLNGRPTPELDNDYNKVDFHQYIFHSTDSSNLYVQYSNNIVAPIRRKTDLRQRDGLNKSLKVGSKAVGGYEQGVYIVDNYTLYHNAAWKEDFKQGLIEYYRNAQDLYRKAENEEDNSDISTRIINDMIYWLNENHRVFLDEYGNIDPNIHYKITFRIITFIPASEIYSKIRLFIPSSNLTIGCGRIPHDLRQPNSMVYRQEARRAESDAKNYIEIEIVDDVAETPYYIKIGNEVHSVVSNNDTTKAKASTMSFYRNTDKIATKTVPTNDIEKLGIYRSKEMAIYHGDLELRNSEEKMKLEYEKIIASKTEIEAKKDSLIREKEIEILRANTLITKLQEENKGREKELEIKQIEYDKKLAEMEREKEIKQIDYDKKMFEMEKDREMKQADYEKKMSDLEKDREYKQIEFNRKIIEMEKDIELTTKENERRYMELEVGMQKASMDLTKTEMERERLAMETEKLRLEKELIRIKFDNSLVMTELERDMAYNTAKIQWAKHVLDIEHTMAKQSMDLEYYDKKYKMETTSKTINNVAGYVGNILSVAKLFV